MYASPVQCQDPNPNPKATLPLGEHPSNVLSFCLHTNERRAAGDVGGGGGGRRPRRSHANNKREAEAAERVTCCSLPSAERRFEKQRLY